MKKPLKIHVKSEHLENVFGSKSKSRISLRPHISSPCYIKLSGLFSTKFEHSAAAEIGTAAESAVDRQLRRSTTLSCTSKAAWHRPPRIVKATQTRCLLWRAGGKGGTGGARGRGTVSWNWGFRGAVVGKTGKTLCSGLTCLRQQWRPWGFSWTFPGKQKRNKYSDIFWIGPVELGCPREGALCFQSST